MHIPGVHVSGAGIELSSYNILHAPDVKKNLLSIRICIDNSVKVEFDDKPVYIKDRTTSDVLHTGGIKDGLYHVDLENFPSVSTVASVSLWNDRVAHINHDAVLRTIKAFNLPGGNRSFSEMPVLCH